MILNYSEIKPTLQTGDVLLFSANFAISRAIEVFTQSPYSHVAMVANYPGADGPDANGANASKPGADGLCFFEATTQATLPCVIDHTIHAGVHLLPLDAVLGYYAPTVNSTYIFRRLQTKRTPEMQAAFARFAKMVDARPFDSYLEMLAHWVEGMFVPVNLSTKSWACSELVAAAYQAMGLLRIAPPANAYAPKDFSMAGTRLQLLDGATMSDEITVFYDGPTTPPTS